MFILLLHSLLPQIARAVGVEWTHVFGTPGGGSTDVASSVSTDASGVYIAGQVFGALPGQVHGGGGDAYLRKYDHDGNELWTRQFGSSGGESALAVHAVGGVVYVAGSQSPIGVNRVDGYVRKYDADGNLLWVRTIAVGASANAVRALSSDASGIYLAGTVHLNVFNSLSQSDIDGIVRKYDHDGNLLWARTIDGTPDADGMGGGFADWATGISAHSSGVYVGGWTANTLAGTTRVGGVDPYVRKYDANGNVLWTRQFGTVTTDQAWGVASDDSGVYIGGQTGGDFPGFVNDGGGLDGFVQKYDHDGNALWTQQFGAGGASISTRAISVDATGVYAAGLVTSQSGFARKFNPDGVLQWSEPVTGIVHGVSAMGSAVYVSGEQLPSGDAFLTKIGQGSNQPPAADAGEDQIVEATSPDGADVTLDSTGSSDPDNDSLTYAWTGDFGTSSEANPTISLLLGVHVITLAVDDGSGNPSSDTVTITVQDTTPPGTTITVKPNANTNSNAAQFEFIGSDIATLPENLAFECRLDTAPFAACSSPISYSGLSEGSHTFEVRATDPSGNTDPTPAFFMWTVDSQPPVLTAERSPAANANGWNNTDVTVTFMCTDDGGIATPPSSPQVLNAEGAGQSATASCTDNAGNTATLTIDDINIDKTAPVIDLTAPPNGASFTLGAQVAASYTCSDGLSGIATCSGTTADGANIETNSAGTKSYAVSATDLAGNSVGANHTYSVRYGFGGFRQPIDNLPVINQANAGKTIPVKWQLLNANGSHISDLGSFASLLSAPIACDGAPSSIVEEQLNPTGGTMFRYDTTENQFIFNWDTSKSWTGCRLLQLTLSDGTLHYAKFNFK